MPHVVTEIRSMHGVRARISAAHTTSQSVRSTRFCTLAAQQTVAWRIEISRCVQVAMFAFILKHGVYRQKWKPRNGPPADARAFNNVRVASFCMKAMQTRTKWPLSSTIYVLCAAGTRVFFFFRKNGRLGALCARSTYRATTKSTKTDHTRHTSKANVENSGASMTIETMLGGAHINP